MHAADAAGGHGTDAGEAARGEGGADRGGAQRAVNDAGREIARAHLPRIRTRGGDPLELPVVEAYVEPPVEDGDRRGDSAAVAYALLALLPTRALARRKAVCDDRRLQGDDRPTVGERVAHLRGDDEELAHGIAPG